MKAGTYEWQSDFALKHIAEGEVKVLLIVLESHGFTLDGDLRQRITTCQDPQQIQTWARRVATAETLDEVFG
ncbi:hypothetical protein E1293_27030 [Actinomadura darangshiensis]|uniref:Uncharacterized protein n=1 Tax=Actinomadura darangshiensis TaxID=705336 RepID=A0A4R5AUX6_9ACTN|nr:hypothetical protein [Actinomadura darangshiensis]TDD76563.1 hypothetical protein E1293_27030 [Actinomadura darangshiensis]